MTKDDDEPETFGIVIENLFPEAFGIIGGSLFDLETKSLMPLFNLNITDDTVTATFDLPGASKDEISITCTVDTISVDAEMTRPVKLRVPGGHIERKEFARYSKRIVLPVRVDPDKGTAKFRNGIVVVKLPRQHEGKSVQIEADSAKRLR
ncbi:MAG: Hsp20/alpha crystallin family protein [Nitrososphaerales archaeon]